MSATRTDIHRPSAPEFDPEAYECVGVFDLHPEEGDGKARMQVVNAFLAQGYSFRGAPHGTGQCSHCGAHIRYAALMLHPATKAMLYVGEICLDNRFEQLTKREFHEARERSRLNRERRTRQERLEAACTMNPVLSWLTYLPNLEGEASEVAEDRLSILHDMAYKLSRYGELSDKQIKFVNGLLTQITDRIERAYERQVERESLVSSGVEVPEGRAQVTGEVVGVKWVDGYGYNAAQVKKLVVKDDRGWKVYVTASSGMGQVERGARVTFTATLTRSDDDPLFGFAKRPTKAEVL